MSNIDKIYSKLIDHQVQAPDIWGKLDAELNNNPTKGLEKKNNKANHTNVITTSYIFKALSIVVGCLVVGVGTYLYLNTNNSEEKLSESKIETRNQNKPINILAEKNNSAYKPISTKSKDNFQPKSVDTQSQLQSPEEYNVNDEKELIIKNANSSISPINSIQTSTPTVILNNTQQSNSTQQEEIKSPVQTLPDIKIMQNVMTPNGDGINDLFEIKNIEKYPENSLVIFDAKGKIIYRCKGYKNNFDAKNIPQGTYFYKLEYNNLGKKQTKPGSITILRN